MRCVSFHDVAEAMGLNQIWPEQPRPITALQAFGAGCAAFDANNDGWQDILLVCHPHPKLFQNHGGSRFEEITAASGLTSLEGIWTGTAVGDYNGDGLLDVLVTGHHCLALYKNNGDFRFELVTTQAGLDPQNEGHWGSSAGFMDLDGDQSLDLVVLNYVIFGPDSKQYCELRPGVLSGCNPRVTYLPEQGRVWRNTGSETFVAIPQSQCMALSHGMGLVLGFVDLDDDDKMDFYIGNDGKEAELMHNMGAMHFDNIATSAGIKGPEYGAAAAMGADWADYDRDGQLDLIISDWQGMGAVLFRGLGSKQFLTRSNPTGITRLTSNRMGFGAKWADFDNDGWVDIFIVNGHVYDNSTNIDGPNAPFRQKLSLLYNDRGVRFKDLLDGLEGDVQRTLLGRGSATIDFNNDGQLDLLAVDFEGPAMLLENRSTVKNHWLKIDLRGQKPNAFAYGAHLIARAGDRVWTADVSPTSSYLSSSDPRIHWGLGDVEVLDSLTIRWPRGYSQTLRSIPADQILTLVEEVPVSTTSN